MTITDLQILEALGIEPPPGYVERHRRRQRLERACARARRIGVDFGLVCEVWFAGDVDIAEPPSRHASRASARA